MCQIRRTTRLSDSFTHLKSLSSPSLVSSRNRHIPKSLTADDLASRETARSKGRVFVRDDERVACGLVDDIPIVRRDTVGVLQDAGQDPVVVDGLAGDGGGLGEGLFLDDDAE